MALKRKKEVSSKPKPKVETSSVLAASVLRTRDTFHSVLALGIFVLLFGTIAITSFLQKSPTLDEPVHLFAGYSYLKWGDFRANPEHPPFVKLFAALPLLAFDIKDPRSVSRDWDLIPTENPHEPFTLNVAARMLFSQGGAETLFFYAKLPMIFVGLILGGFVYYWSKQIFGFYAGLISLFTFCLDPNMLAHSQLVHTDIAFTAVFFVGTYFFWRLLNDLTWFNLFFTALCFAVATITKYSYPILLIVWLVMGLTKVLSPQAQRCQLGRLTELTSPRQKSGALLGTLVCTVLVAYVLVWAAYGFRFHAIPGGYAALPLAQELPKTGLLRSLISFVVEYQLFPEAWIYGQRFVHAHLERSAYLLGSFSKDGFWYYFPLAFAVKTPLATLILVIVGVGLAVLRRAKYSSGRFLLIPAGIYFLFAVLSRMNIGLRHILPIYPFLFVFVGGVVKQLWLDGTWIKRTLLTLAGLWYVCAAASIYPHHLAYFNELVGGPPNGHRVLIDSNLDWGQDIKGLKRWMDTHRVKNIQFLYFGPYHFAVPQYYGIEATYVRGSSLNNYPVETQITKLPRYMAISASKLYDAPPGSGQEEFIRPFRAVKPDVMIGYSIFIYDTERAIAEMRLRAEKQPSSAVNHLLLAILLDNQSQTNDAAGHYRLALQYEPALVTRLVQLANHLALQGKPQSAMMLYEVVLAVEPNSVEAHDRLGVMLAAQGKVGEAIGHYRKILQLTPTRSDVHFNLASALVRESHLEEAALHFQQALQNRADFVDAHIGLGKVLAARGNLDRAIVHFREAVRIDPQLAAAHESLGRALAEQGKKSEAAEHFQEAIRILQLRRSSAN